MQYAFTNGVIYTGYEILYGHAVIVENDLIKAIVPEEELPHGIQQVNLNGNNLTAGFIDLQLNGCGGVMFNEQTTVETLEIMQATNLKSGTTSYLPTFITSPDEGMKIAVKVMRDYLAKYQNQALGLHLEGPYLSKEKKGVHREEYIREITPEMKTFLCDNADVITKITLAAENPTTQYIADFVEKGIIVSLGHSNATYEVANQAIAKGISFATHLHNAMSPISSGRAMGVVGAVLDSDLYAGIIVDGLHVEFGNVRIAKKVKGDKLCIVTDATAAAGSDIESFIFVGKTVYVRDGKCYDANGTLGGASVTMIESVENAVKKVGISLDETLRMFTHDFKVIGTAVNGEWTAN